MDPLRLCIDGYKSRDIVITPGPVTEVLISIYELTIIATKLMVLFPLFSITFGVIAY